MQTASLLVAAMMLWAGLAWGLAGARLLARTQVQDHPGQYDRAEKTITDNRVPVGRWA